MVRTKTNFVLHVLVINYLFSVYQYLIGGRIYLFRLAGINILNEDIVGFFIILALINYLHVNHGVVEWSRNISKLILLFSGVALFGLVSAIFSYGLSSTVLTNMRSFLVYIILPILYFSIVPIEIDLRFKKEIKLVAVVVMTIFTVLWILDIGAGIRPFEIQVREDHLRVIGPHQALLFAMMALYELNDNDGRDGFGVFGLVMSVFVILMQYRTVWMAFFAGFIVTCYKRLIVDKQLTNKKMLLQIIILIVMLSFFVFNSSGIVSESIMANVDSFSDLESGTFGFRMEYWKAILSSMTTKNWIIGKSMGEGYPLEINPHSFIIKALAKTGWIGLLLVELFLLSLIKRAINYKIYFVIALAVSVIVFGISYDYNLEAGVIIGTCCYIIRENLYIQCYDINKNKGGRSL